MSYKQWYEEAIEASNELGFAGMSAEQVIRYQAEELEELRRSEKCFNAVINHVLGKGYMESPLEFLRCWAEGDFDSLRNEWPDAPKDIYLADPLYKEEL